MEGTSDQNIEDSKSQDVQLGLQGLSVVTNINNNSLPNNTTNVGEQDSSFRNTERTLIDEINGTHHHI